MLTRREWYGRTCSRHAGMRPYISGRAAVASRPRLAVLVGGSAGSWTFVLKTLQSKTIYLTQACTIQYQ